MYKKQESTQYKQYTRFNVETLNGENYGNRESTIQSEKYRREESRITTLFGQSVSNVTGLLASKLTQLWHRSHSLPLCLTLCVHYNRITLSTTLQFYNPNYYIIMFALDVFILIHSIGLFTNIAPNGTLTLFANIALSWLRPI